MRLLMNLIHELNVARAIKFGFCVDLYWRLLVTLLLELTVKSKENTIIRQKQIRIWHSYYRIYQKQ